MLERTNEELTAVEAAGTVKVVLADVGYYSEGNVCNANRQGPELLLATIRTTRSGKR